MCGKIPFSGSTVGTKVWATEGELSALQVGGPKKETKLTEVCGRSVIRVANSDVVDFKQVTRDMSLVSSLEEHKDNSVATHGEAIAKFTPLLDGGQGKMNTECVIKTQCATDREEDVETAESGEAKQQPRRRRRLRKHQRKKARKQVPALHQDSSSDDESSDEGDRNMPFCKWVKKFPGLQEPRLATGVTINGTNKRQHRRENKARRIALQEEQEEVTYWETHEGTFGMPKKKEELEKWRGQMCPRGLALHHPAAGKLLQYATGGCPSNTGQPWTKQQMQEAIDRGPHVSALEPDAMEQFHMEVAEKVRVGHAKVVNWDDIKDNPPPQLKISPLAMIPHKSRKYRAILDLSFRLRLKNGEFLTSVNDSTTLSAPAGAIDQLGHSLNRIIHAFAEADPDDKIFMAKFDIKDGFWRLMCEEGEEWNFAYVLPQKEGEPVKLVVPLSLQMGWVESPTYFCAASETARDTGAKYAETPIGSLPSHKFEKYAMDSKAVQALPESAPEETRLRYFLDVYVDDFINLAIAASQEQIRHLGRATMHGTHDVFPADDKDEEDPISFKKLKKGEGTFDTKKEILGFDFDGEAKTMNLAEGRLQLLVESVHRWIRHSKRGRGGIPFPEFRSTISKCRHAFMSIPAGKGLLTECNKVLGLEPPVVYLQRSKALTTCLDDARRLLRESGKKPTPCRQLVMGEPGYVGVKDASVHGVGGVVIGNKKACTPVVFRLEWPQDIKEEVWKTNSGKKGNLTNSDLECAGLLLLWLVMEEVCGLTAGDHVALFSDNSPTVSWVTRMAARGSLVAGQLLRALALRMKVKEVSPLSTLHIQGEKNAMTDIPSRSFGSEIKWHCKTEEELLTLFNSTFPLPQQKSWTIFHLSSKCSMRVISLLRMQVSSMDEWQRLPRTGRLLGEIGTPMSNLWEWTLSYRDSDQKRKLESSLGSQQGSELEDMVAAERSKLTRLRRRSRPLAKRSTWCAALTQQKHQDQKG